MVVKRTLLAAVRTLARFEIALSLSVLALFLVVSALHPAHAMKIKQVESPGGIKAWLVEEHSVPLLAMRFAFSGGNAQDPDGKEGVAHFLTAMMDEGAGDLDATAFQERVEDIAMRMRFSDDRDDFYGSFETLTKNRDKAAELLKLALTKPRFDLDAVERMRKQLHAGLVYDARDPQKVASKEWFRVAFGDHVYARPTKGTSKTLAAITREDLVDYHAHVFAKDTLKVVAVGDITAEELGALLDKVFSDLPEKANLKPVAAIQPKAGIQKIVKMDVPQSVAVFGLGAMARKDKDFMPAFILNHILGGGGFSSRLMEEVREKRGLAYSVYSYISPFRNASVLMGGVATKNESIATSLDVIRAELKRISEKGPSPQELKNAQDYLTGSYALRFDTNSKIAGQLLGVMVEDVGIDYPEKRNDLVRAVTLEDIKRVAKSLLQEDKLIVTIVGKPMNMPEDEKKG